MDTFSGRSILQYLITNVGSINFTAFLGSLQKKYYIKWFYTWNKIGENKVNPSYPEANTVWSSESYTFTIRFLLVRTIHCQPAELPEEKGNKLIVVVTTAHRG